MFRLAFAAALAALASFVVGQGPWPLERQDRYGTARALSGPDPSSFVSPWVFKVYSPGYPVSHGASFGMDGIGYYGDWVTNRLFKFYYTSGGPISYFLATNFIQCTPAISPFGRIFIHAQRNFQNDPPGRLFSVNPSNMDYDWFFNTNADKVNDYEAASPVLGPEGDVAIGSTNGTAWRIDYEFGGIVWARSGLQSCYRTAAFTRDDSKVIICNGSSVTALNWSNGTIAWNTNLGGTAGAPGVAPNGTIVVGDAAGTIYGLNPANGAILWTRLVLGRVRPAPAFSPDGTIAYVCSDDFRMYAIRVSDGFRLWTFTTSHECRNAPAVGPEGRIYLYNRIGDIYCVSPSGSQIWNERVQGDGRGPITIDPNGTIYCGFSDANPGGLYAITQLPVFVSPDSFSYVSGSNISGGLPEMLASDDMHVVSEVGSEAQDQLPFVEMFVQATSPRSQLRRLTFKLEASCQLELPQVIALRNYQNNQFEVLDTRTATFFDSTATVVVSTNASRFVHQGTRRMEAYLAWGTLGLDVDVWRNKIDLVQWTLEPQFLPLN